MLNIKWLTNNITNVEDSYLFITINCVGIEVEWLCNSEGWDNEGGVSRDKFNS